MILINSSPKDTLKIFQPFLPISAPIGLGFLLAACEQNKIAVKHIDEQVEDDVLDLTAKYVKEMEPPYIFGFSVLTPAFKNAIILSEELKRIYPDSKIIFGGIHPTAMPEEVLAYKHIDAVVRGEGEKALIELYRYIKAEKNFTAIDNLSYRRNGKIIHNNISPLLDINLLPSFPYHLFTSKKYDLGFVVSSRGCPYRCIFCSNRVITGRKYRYRSAEFVVSELETLYYKHNITFVIFSDDDLCVSKERIYTLIDAIRKKGLDKKMVFSFQSRGDNVNYEMLKDLFEAGFKSIFFGMETSSEKIMKTIKKDETVAQCVEAARIAKQIGYYVSATFIYGLPGDTHQDRMNCVDLSKELKIDMVRYNNATPYPGTELYEIAKKENRLRIEGLYENFCSVSTFIENPFKKIPFSYVPEGNSEEEIRMDILFSYFSSYLNYSRLRDIFAKSNRGAGWFKAGQDLIQLIKKMPSLIVLGFMLCIKFFQLARYLLIKKWCFGKGKYTEQT